MDPVTIATAGKKVWSSNLGLSAIVGSGIASALSWGAAYAVQPGARLPKEWTVWVAVVQAVLLFCVGWYLSVTRESLAKAGLRHSPGVVAGAFVVAGWYLWELPRLFPSDPWQGLPYSMVAVAFICFVLFRLKGPSPTADTPSGGRQWIKEALRGVGTVGFLIVHTHGFLSMSLITVQVLPAGLGGFACNKRFHCEQFVEKPTSQKAQRAPH